MRAIIAHDDNVDTAIAIRSVISECDRQLAGVVPSAALLFTTTEYEHRLILRAIQQRWPGLPLVGSTTDGELSSRLGYRDDSICLTLLVGEELEVVTGQGIDCSLDVQSALDRAIAPLGNRRPALCLALCVGTSGNPGALVAALHERMKEFQCPVVGGLSADHAVAQSTLQFFGEDSRHDSIALLFLCGDVHASWGASSGWFPIGVKHRITRSIANKVYEIDGKPALGMYQSFWGEHAITHLGEFPLAVSRADGRSEFY